MYAKTYERFLMYYFTNALCLNFFFHCCISELVKYLYSDYVSLTHRQDLFVILRDFSGLTQVLIPQEEVRMTETLILSLSYHKFINIWRTIPVGIKTLCELKSFSFFLSLLVDWKLPCVIWQLNQLSRWREQSDSDQWDRRTRSVDNCV